MHATTPHRYANADWGFAIDHPDGWRLARGFPGTYLANGSWRTFADPGSQGTAVVALVVPGSNHISAAEIRIGASTATDAIAHCTQPPSATRPGSVASQDIGGTGFTRFVAEDAAMSHRLRVHGFRTVHDGACYAIDLAVFGTNPDVYDPPATPPFRDNDVFARMQAVLRSFRFTR